MYKGEHMRISAKAAAKLKEMNRSIFCDRKFVKVLLMEIFDKNRLQNVDPLGLDAKRISFIQEVYGIRVGNDTARKSRFLSIVQTHCDNARQRTGKKTQ